MAETSTATVGELLPRLHFTSQLPDEVRGKLASIATLCRFSPGQYLCREGEAAPYLYLIAEGHVALDMHVPGRGQVRLLTLGPGEILAWSAVVGNHGATATGIASGDVLVIAFREQDVSDLCQANHDVGYLLMKALAMAVSRRLVATRLQLLDLFREQSPQYGQHS